MFQQIGGEEMPHGIPFPPGLFRPGGQDYRTGYHFRCILQHSGNGIQMFMYGGFAFVDVGTESLFQPRSLRIEVLLDTPLGYLPGNINGAHLHPFCPVVARLLQTVIL